MKDPAMKTMNPMPLALACLAAALLASGCAQTPTSTGPDGSQAPISTAPYAGPGVAIETRSTTHGIIISTPTGGWSVVWDGTFDTQDKIHLTIRRPDPDFLHVQQIVEHRIDSTVPSGNPLEVFVRVVDHNDRTGSSPYLSAARVAG